tara:strand:+ start:244 stop:357 length:114 start_codon:yes stop_codon:yes gene_type:complete
MMEILNVIFKKEKEYIYGNVVRNMMDIGKMIYKKVKD